jgi:hypothetical protein
VPLNIERRNEVGSTHAVYSGGPCFNSHTGDRLFWPSVVSLSY